MGPNQLDEARPELQPVDWDPLHQASSPEEHWTTSNVGEAIPGVVTPLCWSIWGPAGERGLRNAAHAIGLLSAAERGLPPDTSDRWVRAFYGRVAMQIEFMGLVGDRMPGTTGQEAVAGVFGTVPEGMRFSPTKRRYPAIALRFPASFAGFPRALRRLVSDYDAWWRESISRVPGLDAAGAVALLLEADRRFNEAETLQTLAVFGSVQPAFDGLSRLIDRAGVGDIGTLSGTGGAELAVVGDIWRASRGQLTTDEVIGNHGFHGPREGELSSRVWREDPGPIALMIEQYASRPDDANPLLIEEQRLPVRRAMEREVLATLPRVERPLAKAVLRTARHRIPMRGVAKRAFLQALDVARAAARHAGAQLEAGGRLESAEDIFHLTLEEIGGEWPAGARDLIERRKARRRDYEGVALPEKWRGMPTTREMHDEGSTGTVAGVGVSPGIAEGPVRIVLDPAVAEVEPDEILVAPTTDPSWSAIMFVSAALVVDIGGPLSHAAVVARELQIPCVVNTRNGSKSLRTGDRVRVDGTTGAIEILSRA